MKFEKNTLNIPAAQRLIQGPDTVFPFVNVDDEGFGLFQFRLLLCGGKWL
jgi:hypothetical protein